MNQSIKDNEIASQQQTMSGEEVSIRRAIELRVASNE
jgi:hypothetical protein